MQLFVCQHLAGILHAKRLEHLQAPVFLRFRGYNHRFLPLVSRSNQNYHAKVLPRRLSCRRRFLSGFIHFNEFLAAAIQQRHMDEQSLRPAFDRLDRSHTGFINLDDVTLTTGAAANEEESRVLVGHFDMNGDGQVSEREREWTCSTRCVGAARVSNRAG